MAGFDENHCTVFNDCHVMVVEEDNFMAKLLHTVLASFGVGKITMMDEIEAAKKYLKAHSVDCIMLEWTGWEKPKLELLPFIRKTGELKNNKIPVIMCTGHSGYQYIIKARDGGADEIIIKPISPLHVYEKLYGALYNVRDFIDHDALPGLTDAGVC